MTKSLDSTAVHEVPVSWSLYIELLQSFADEVQSMRWKGKATTQQLAESNPKMEALELKSPLLVDKAKQGGTMQRRLDSKVNELDSTKQRRRRRRLP